MESNWGKRIKKIYYEWKSISVYFFFKISFKNIKYLFNNNENNIYYVIVIFIISIPIAMFIDDSNHDGGPGIGDMPLFTISGGCFIMIYFNSYIYFIFFFVHFCLK